MRKILMRSMVMLCAFVLLAGGTSFAASTQSQIDALTQKANHYPDVLDRMNIIYQFNIDSETFQVDVHDNSATYTRGTPWTAECVISMNKENFDKLLSGELSPFRAYLSGKLKVKKGSLSHAKQLGDVITELNQLP